MGLRMVKHEPGADQAFAYFHFFVTMNYWHGKFTGLASRRQITAGLRIRHSKINIGFYGGYRRSLQRAFGDSCPLLSVVSFLANPIQGASS